MNLKEKKVMYAMIAVLVVLLGATSTLGYLFYKSSVKLEQANTVISARTDEIQEFNKKLGIAESNLRTEENLTKKYKKEIESLDEEFLKIKSKYNLDLKSRDNTIAYLKGKVKGGKSSVVIPKTPENSSEVSGVKEFTTVIEVTREICNNEIVGYQWEDENKRFKLKDPDIFEEGNEEFEYKQHFKITGYVFEDATGNIQVKKLELEEVYPEENEKGVEYKAIKNSNISLVSSKFEYTNKVKDEKHLLDIVTLRPIASFDTAVTPGLGLEVINLGRYFDYLNVGFYGKLAFDVSDPLGGSLQNSRIGVGINYHLIPPLLDTNFAIGTSVSTPFNDLGAYVLTVDLILYLTDDLNPFQWLK